MSHHYIEFKDVSFRYASGQQALNNVNFRISHGQKVALLGKNGAGKSTLLLHTNGLLMPTEGEVNVGGVPVTKKTLPLVRQTVGMVFQNPDDQLFMPTVEEDVAFGPLNMKLPADEIERRIDKALRAVGCLDLAKRSSMQLSGGQKRRVAIATVLSMEPSILVLDEPTSNLDWDARQQVADMINGFDHTCLIATHDLGLIRDLCPLTMVLDGGRLIAFDETHKVLSDNNILKTLGIPEKLAGYDV